MNIFRWIYTKCTRTKKQQPDPDGIAIEIPTIITPEKIYADCIYRIYDSGMSAQEREEIAEKTQEISYLKDDVRKKAGQPLVRKEHGNKYEVDFIIDTIPIKVAWAEINILRKYTLFQISYEEFLRHQKLPQIVELVMKTPFLVMLADLELVNEKDYKDLSTKEIRAISLQEVIERAKEQEGGKENQSWYQKLKARITKERAEAHEIINFSLNEEQRTRVEAVLLRLKLFEAELEKAAEYLRVYCRHSLNYIEKMRTVINEMVTQKRIELLEKNTHHIAQEATALVQKKYDILHAHALRVNASLNVFGVSDDIQLGELTPDALEKLEKGSAQLQINLHDIQTVYFGEEILEHSKQTA